MLTGTQSQLKFFARIFSLFISCKLISATPHSVFKFYANDLFIKIPGAMFSTIEQETMER